MRISQMLMRAVCMYCILRLRYYTNAHAYRGTNGSTSLGLSTNLHMLITTVAALRFSCIAPRLVRDLPLVEQNGWFVDRWEQNDGCYQWVNNWRRATRSFVRKQWRNVVVVVGVMAKVAVRISLGWR